MTDNFLTVKDEYMWVHYTIHLYFCVCIKSILENLVTSTLIALTILVIN